MKKQFRFIKENSGRWYIDLSEWPGDRCELEMVLGADILLDIISGDSDVCHLTISTEPFVVDTEPIETNAHELTKIQDTPDIGGATYFIKDWFGMELNMEIWLCHVTEFVFGSMPQKIYIA